MTGEKSSNEIEALVLKAARGGGLPLGLAEDLAAAAPYLDLSGLRVCPCSGAMAAKAIPSALDALVAGEGAQNVVADAALIAAYVAAFEVHNAKTVDWAPRDDGGTLHGLVAPKGGVAKLGRRVIPADLEAHLIEMASKTLVPETESSRQAGAGAGLTDND